MTSVAQPRRAGENNKFALQRVCGVCRHFMGATIRSSGICDKFGKQTSGTTGAMRCDKWTRRAVGLDPVPFGDKAPIDLKTELTPDELAGARAFLADPVTMLKPAPPSLPKKVAAVPRPKERIAVAVDVVEARRARLRELLSQRPEITAGEAGDELKLPAWQVRGDAKAIGVELKRAPSRYDPSVADLRDRVKQAFDGVRTIAEIASVVGAHVRTVSGHLDALKLKAPAGMPGRSIATLERMKARQAKVRELVAAGKLSRTEIAAALKISTRTLSEDMFALEIELPAGKVWPQRAPVIASSSGPSGEIVEASRALSNKAYADGKALAKQAQDMIRLARNCSIALYSLADELEVFLKQQEARS